MAQKSVDRYNLSPAEEKELFDLHMGNSKQFEIRIDDPTTYVEATSQTQELQIEYVQAYPGDVTKH